jgi:hypothetical protein
MLGSKTKNGQQAQFKNYSTTWKNDKASSRTELTARMQRYAPYCCKLTTLNQNCWLNLYLPVILSHRQKLNKFHLFSALNKITSSYFT